VGNVAANLQVKTWFPENPSLEFHPGKLVSALMGVRNVGESSVNLTLAVGNLAFVNEPAGNVFNFTGAVRATS